MTAQTTNRQRIFRVSINWYEICLKRRAMTQYLVYFLLSCLGIGMTDNAHSQSLPMGFVYVDQVVPELDLQSFQDLQ